MSDSADARLWHAVLAHGLTDVAAGKDAGWIGSRDFHEVCNLAGLDPDAVLERFDPDRFRRLIRAA